MSPKPQSVFFLLFSSSLPEGCSGNHLWIKPGELGPSCAGLSGRKVERGSFSAMESFGLGKGEN